MIEAILSAFWREISRIRHLINSVNGVSPSSVHLRRPRRRGDSQAGERMKLRNAVAAASARGIGEIRAAAPMPTGKAKVLLGRHVYSRIAGRIGIAIRPEARHVDHEIYGG